MKLRRKYLPQQFSFISFIFLNKVCCSTLSHPLYAIDNKFCSFSCVSSEGRKSHPLFALYFRILLLKEKNKHDHCRLHSQTLNLLPLIYSFSPILQEKETLAKHGCSQTRNETSRKHGPQAQQRGLRSFSSRQRLRFRFRKRRCRLRPRSLPPRNQLLRHLPVLWSDIVREDAW